MKLKDASVRYVILMHGIKTGNVSRTCEIFNISRTTYYKWYSRYKKYGIEGLKDREKCKPNMPNKISSEVENIILNLVINNPNDGPRRLLYNLKELDIDISEAGVYNVLKRNNLSTREKRIQFAKKNEYTSTSIVNKSNKITLEDIYNSYPGYALQQGTRYIGKFNNIGKVYIISIIDCFSQFAIAKVYGNKSFQSVKDIFETKLIPMSKAFQVEIKNIITNESREYATNWDGGKHKYDKLLDEYKIKHIKIPATEKSNIAFLENLNDIMYEEFFKSILIKNDYISLDELQGDLQHFMIYYNLERVMEKGIHKGKTPMEVFKEVCDDKLYIPIWVLINSMNI